MAQNIAGEISKSIDDLAFNRRFYHYEATDEGELFNEISPRSKQKLVEMAAREL